MKGEHKVTVTVEIDGGETVVSRTLEFSGGNPLWHAPEFFKTASAAVLHVQDGIAGIYGDIRERNSSDG